MRADDVVRQLAINLPKHTDMFTNNVSVDSVVPSSIGPTLTEVLVNTTTDHNLSVGHRFSLLGSNTPLEIATFTRVGEVGTIVTTENHDFTFGLAGALSGTGSLTANCIGANEAEFNGDFVITGVTNRKTIIVDIDDSGATTATGTLRITNGSSVLQTYNGSFGVKAIPSTTSFTYDLPIALPLAPVGTMVIKSNVRASAAISLQSIKDSYTEQDTGDLWIFVVLEDSVASKNRSILSDATENLQRSNYYRQQITQPFSLYVLFPTCDEIAARNSRDVAEEIFRSICQSILFKRLDTLLSSGENNPISFLAHGLADYSDAFYIHQYSFEQIADILFEDTVGHDEDVAFRDIDFTIGLDVGTEQLTADLNLDEEQLP